MERIEENKEKEENFRKRNEGENEEKYELWKHKKKKKMLWKIIEWEEYFVMEILYCEADKNVFFFAKYFKLAKSSEVNRKKNIKTNTNK